MESTEKICEKCGTKNVEAADFCLKCGLRFKAKGESSNNESLVYLHVLGSSYLLFTALLNSSIRSLAFPSIGVAVSTAGILIYLFVYLIPVISGFYVAYEVNRKRIKREVNAISLWTSAMGALGTGWLFFLGGGIIGPAWLIFLASAIKTVYIMRR